MLLIRKRMNTTQNKNKNKNINIVEDKHTKKINDNHILVNNKCKKKCEHKIKPNKQTNKQNRIK